jgi:primase-polymerase (primpol)-like protein
MLADSVSLKKGRVSKEEILTSDEKPAPMKVRAKYIPLELRDRPQWVCWAWNRRIDEKTDKGRWTKVPINPLTGKQASVTDPTTWGSFKDAYKRHRAGKTDGVGFVFTEADPFCGVDLDGCRDPETGQIDSWAQELIDDLDSYTEVSPTGTGLKIFVKATKPGAKCKAAFGTGEVEIHDHARYFTVTGHSFDATGEDRCA